MTQIGVPTGQGRQGAGAVGGPAPARRATDDRAADRWVTGQGVASMTQQDIR